MKQIFLVYKSLKGGIDLGWMQMLAQTYDEHEAYIGEEINGQPMLLPVFHSTVNAQIELTIDYDGNFNPNLTKIIEKDGKEEVTVIPVTESSASRSSGISPHPLCDKLCYVAGDYSVYTKEKKEKYYEVYMEGLKKWVNSDYTHKMIQAVYKYLAKGTVIKDLVEIGILKLDEKGVFADRINKIQGQDQKGAVIRFRVVGEKLGVETAVWKEKKLYELFIKFYEEMYTSKDICYVTGKMEVCSDKHPSKIRHSGDKAKLISGNDESGFTYRGRFVRRNEAVSVGYITSQKAHNALKWLLDKQGYKKDGAAIVVWEVHGKNVPDIFQSSAEAYVKYDSMNEIEDFPIEEDIDLGDELEEDLGTGERYAKKIRNAMAGYANKFTLEDNVIMIGLDAATTGRLSITYYHEFQGNDFIQRVQNWHTKCTWWRYFCPQNEKKGYWVDSAPAPRDIALAAFGTERNKGYLQADEKLIRNTVQRLLPCITGGVRIPQDIIRAVVRQASSPERMSEFVWYNQVLTIACALIKYDTYKGEVERMKLTDTENMNDRDFQFGRLLAVLDRVECVTLLEKDEKGKWKDIRTTNAKRYWNAYSRRPETTYKIIMENLRPYFRKMKSSVEEWYQTQIDDIIVQIKQEDFNDRPLGPKYLVGYSIQRNEMKREKEDKQENNKENQEVIENE